MKKFDEWVLLQENQQQQMQAQGQQGQGQQGQAPEQDIQGLRTDVERFMHMMISKMDAQRWTKPRKIEFITQIMNQMGIDQQEFATLTAGIRGNM